MAKVTLKIFSVWVDTVDGDLMTCGTEPGRGLSREVAWAAVKHYQGKSTTSQIRVLRGSSPAWRWVRGAS